MAEPFLSLDARERADILRTLAANSGRSAVILEKDIWVCWVLHRPSSVTVLSPARTFWEKATLSHVACHRRRLANSPDRLSRHWFDLKCLADHAVGQAALSDRDLLQNVVQHKKVFFHVGDANYDQCLDGRLRLVPDDDQLPALQSDYDAMRNARIVGDDAPEFDALIERLRILEADANRPS